MMFSENERTQLNSFRYACTVLSSVVVYGLAYVFLQSSDTDELGWADRKIFTTLAIIVVGIGSVFSVIFHLLTPEKKPRGPNEKGFNIFLSIFSLMKGKTVYKNYHPN